MSIRSDFTPMELAFRDFMRTQKCPFRATEKSYLASTVQEMMPCDPDCVTLVYSEGDNSMTYYCLRLTNNPA